MELSDLVGRHVLNTSPVHGIKPKDPNSYYRDDAATLTIGIDGNTYTFIEDPSDGYRSALEGVEMEQGLTAKLNGSQLINREVWINYLDKCDYEGNVYGDYAYKSDIIQIVDMETGHVWGLFGTTNIDDYYPSCVMVWNDLKMDEIAKIAAAREMKEIPISAAKAIAEIYGYDQVVVYARRVGADPHPFGEHMTTYGVTTAHCSVAANIGDTLKKFMKWDV